MTGGLISGRVALAIGAVVLAVVGFFTVQAVQNKNDARDDRACDYTVALGGTTDDC